MPEYNDGLEALKVLEKDFGILDAVISSLEVLPLLPDLLIHASCAPCSPHSAPQSAEEAGDSMQSLSMRVIPSNQQSAF